MVLKLVGHPLAVCAKTVATVLHEKNIPYELIEVDFFNKEHKSPAHLEKQPFGQIPYIDDDGFILYESRAISRYLQDKFPNSGTSLIPTSSDLKAKALFEQAASIEQNNFQPYVAAIAFERVFKKLFHNKESDESIVTEKSEVLSAKLDVYDQILGKQKYLAGDEITLADIFHLAYGQLLELAGSDLLNSKPNVARWWKDITERPSWQAVKDGVKSNV